MHPTTYRDRTMIERATAPLHERIVRLQQELDIAAGAIEIAKTERDRLRNLVRESYFEGFYADHSKTCWTSWQESEARELVGKQPQERE